MNNYQIGYDAFKKGVSFDANQSPFWRYGWKDARDHAEAMKDFPEIS